VLPAGGQPESRDRVAQRYLLDVLVWRVKRRQLRVLGEDVGDEDRRAARTPPGRNLAGTGREVAAQAADVAKAVVVLKPDVGGAVAALGVASDPPGPAGWHDPEVVADPIGDIAAHE